MPPLTAGSGPDDAPGTASSPVGRLCFRGLCFKWSTQAGGPSAGWPGPARCAPVVGRPGPLALAESLTLPSFGWAISQAARQRAASLLRGIASLAGRAGPGCQAWAISPISRPKFRFPSPGAPPSLCGPGRAGPVSRSLTRGPAVTRSRATRAQLLAARRSTGAESAPWRRGMGPGIEAERVGRDGGGRLPGGGCRGRAAPKQAATGCCHDESVALILTTKWTGSSHGQPPVSGKQCLARLIACCLIARKLKGTAFAVNYYAESPLCKLLKNSRRLHFGHRMRRKVLNSAIIRALVKKSAKNDILFIA